MWMLSHAASSVDRALLGEKCHLQRAVCSGTVAYTRAQALTSRGGNMPSGAGTLRGLLSKFSR